ncbi:MAG: cytochrome C oxidase subunit IV family protein [Lautropia mirabilis]|nr:cytochrome C oxidase subunit IV family protein [Lautropia mirabilis]
MSAPRHSSHPAAAGRHPPASDPLGQLPRVSGTGLNIGFLLAVVLTLIPFGLVMTNAFEDSASAALIIMGLGVVQIIVHMVYFLQLNRRAEGSWIFPALIVTVLLVAILLVGTLWGMPPLDGNAAPGS